MERTGKLYLTNDFNKVYREIQRPAAAVKKTHSATELSKVFEVAELPNHEKVRQYIYALHRYLNLTSNLQHFLNTAKLRNNGDRLRLKFDFDTAEPQAELAEYP